MINYQTTWPMLNQQQQQLQLNFNTVEPESKCIYIFIKNLLQTVSVTLRFQSLNRHKIFEEKTKYCKSKTDNVMLAFAPLISKNILGDCRSG